MQIDQLNTIATFFATLVALIIFINWKKQKGSEVISNEAKETFYLVKPTSANQYCIRRHA
jgi:hypothetical protein